MKRILGTVPVEPDGSACFEIPPMRSIYFALLDEQGESVKRGQIIGLVGSSGRSLGPHLHYEIRLNGLAVNPTKYFFD